AVVWAAGLVSYGGAKAGSLGFDARGGLMERAERLIVLGFGLLFESLLVPVLWGMLGLTLITGGQGVRGAVVLLVLPLIPAGQRFEGVWRQASAPQVQPLAVRWRARRVARSTQRTWPRQAVGHRRAPWGGARPPNR